MSAPAPFTVKVPPLMVEGPPGRPTAPTSASVQVGGAAVGVAGTGGLELGPSPAALVADTTYQ